MNEFRWTPDRWPVLGPIWQRIEHELADGEWHGYADVRAVVVESGALRSTTDNLLASARRARAIERCGGYSPKTGRDTRMIRLVGLAR